MTGPADLPPEDTITDTPSTRVVIVSGPAGAGRTTAIRAFEDIGFEVIDNLPLTLLPRLLEGPPPSRPMALGIDARNRDFSVAAFFDAFRLLDTIHGVQGELLYLDCSEDVLIRRYSETRRRHPLAPAEVPLLGIRRECTLLEPVRAAATTLIDTSALTVHDLRAEIEATYGSGVGLAVTVSSFSYKRGLPRTADMVFDCRFLRNPHWDPVLRSLDGRDAAVADYVKADIRFSEFRLRVAEMLEFLLPAWQAEGKTHLVIAFGCTGGQHRSVMMAEEMRNALEALGWPVSISHRELDRQAANARSTNTGQRI
ncbi:nucleotide-binding protein [Ketogulonicigenium robustum]|uniref:Nucleotide-binding protein n=1 Tax=Ketogulonicigenium robustum TaxID=92947 RepID=A0A1W6NWW3_9RHOB|nr:RNase adapter RapZ [Ketogulonicigenium robustum]ARO13600.1 nucleotide-binding protein [Ketogulonicigenium robustum]